MKLQTLLSTYVFTVLLQHSDEEQLSSDSTAYLTVQIMADIYNPEERKLDHFFNIETMIDLSTKQFYFFENPVLLRLSVPDSIIGHPIQFLQFVNNQPYELTFSLNCSKNANSEDFCQKYNTGSKGYCCPESTQVRCILYDPLWYSINTLEKAVVIQGVGIDVFTREAHAERKGPMKGVAESNRLLVNGKTIDRKDNKLYFTARIHNISNSTSSTCVKSICPNLNYLFIPISNPTSSNGLQTLQNMRGVREYLLIKKKMFNLKGISCGATGISIGSVLRKNDQCSYTFVKTCSKDQPLDQNGVDTDRSKYFLSQFVEPVAPYIGKIPGWNPNNPLLFVANTQRPDKAKMEMFINLNKNLFPFAIPLIGKGSIGTLYSHPFTDDDNRYELGINILNTGLVTGSFKILLDCEMNKQFKTFILMPYQGQTVIFYQNIELTIEGESENTTPVDIIKQLLPSQCQIELWNEDKKTMKSKELILKENKICICLEGCKCSCDLPYTCEIMEIVPTTQFTPVKETLNIWAIVCTLLLLCMLLNFLKFTCGFCFPILVGEAGLCVFIKSSYQCKYFDKDLERKAVEYNEDGYPVHPNTKERVRALQYKTMGALNLLFFFYLPFIGFHWLLVRNKINKKRSDLLWDKLETTVEMVQEGDDKFCLHAPLRRTSWHCMSSDQSELPDHVQEERNCILEEYGRSEDRAKCREDSVSKSLARSQKLFTKDCQRKSTFKSVFNNFLKTEKEPSSSESSDCQKDARDTLKICLNPRGSQSNQESSSSSEQPSCPPIKKTTKKDKCS